jgi:hypothetical protein
VGTRKNTANLTTPLRRNFHDESFRFVDAGTHLQIGPDPRARKPNKKGIFRLFLFLQKGAGARSIMPKKPTQAGAQHT